MRKSLFTIIFLVILLLIASGFFIIRNYLLTLKLQETSLQKRLTPGHPFEEKYQLSQEEKKGLGIDPNLSVTGETITGGANSLGPIRVLKIEKPAIIDNDSDGLSDEEEKILGADPLKRDTDKDGLDDKDEVRWKTDPLKPDTDGDGYRDGEEIKGGYDPLGLGEIKNLK